MDITAVSYICQIGFSRINLYQPSAEGLAKQHESAQFPIRFILDKKAGGIAQDQPEENDAGQKNRVQTDPGGKY